MAKQEMESLGAKVARAQREVAHERGEHPDCPDCVKKVASLGDEIARLKADFKAAAKRWEDLACPSCYKLAQSLRPTTGERCCWCEGKGYIDDTEHDFEDAALAAKPAPAPPAPSAAPPCDDCESCNQDYGCTGHEHRPPAKARQGGRE